MRSDLTWADLQKQLLHIVNRAKHLDDLQVYVGVPSAGTDRSNEEFNSNSNADLAYIHNYGDQSARIPARPFIEPGIEAARDVNEKLFAEADEILFGDGGETALRTVLTKVGINTTNEMRRVFTSNDNNWPELKASTLAARRSRGRKGSRPLLDTGQLVKSLSFIVTKDKKV